jgi:hypothetical protein
MLPAGGWRGTRNVCRGEIIPVDIAIRLKRPAGPGGVMRGYEINITPCDFTSGREGW